VRARSARRVLRLVVLVAVLAALPGCTKDGKEDGDAARRTSDRTGSGAPSITFTVDGAVETNGTKAPTDEDLTQVKATLDAYLARAVVEPLHTGRPAGDLSDLFSVEARPRLTDQPTRATLVEEGLPPASTSITADAATVKLSSVAGPDGVIALIAARLDVKLHAVGPRIDIDIARDGELVLTRDDGRWRIDSFGVRTTRNTRDAAGGGDADGSS
jgi:hypothetical protein